MIIVNAAESLLQLSAGYDVSRAVHATLGETPQSPASLAAAHIDTRAGILIIETAAI